MHDLPRPVRAAFGCIGAILLVASATIALRYGQGYYDAGYEVSAVFPSSSQGLFTDGGSDVKLRGVNVGTVRDIELLDDGRARITLFLHEGVEVPSTATASIEPLSVFGPKFIRIQPGSGEGSDDLLHDGDEIARTVASVELTEILASATELFGEIDPRDLVTIFDAVAEGVSGLGEEIGLTIDSAGELLDVGARHTEDLRRFLADLAALSQVLADHADDALAITDDLAAVLPVLTRDADRLGDLLDATSAISGSFADLLEDNAVELDTTLRAVATFVDGVDARASEVPAFVGLLGSFFGRLTDVIRFPAPAGKLMGGLRGFLALDACLILDLCLEEIATAPDAQLSSAAAAASAPAPTVPGPPTLVRLYDLLVAPA